MANGTKGYTPFQFGTGDPQGALQGTTWGQSNMTGGGSNWLMDMFKAQTPNVGAGGAGTSTGPLAPLTPQEKLFGRGVNFTRSGSSNPAMGYQLGRPQTNWWDQKPGGTVWPGQQLAFNLAKGNQAMMGNFLNQLGGFFGGGGGIGGGFGGAWPPLVGSIAGTNAPPSAQTG